MRLALSFCSAAARASKYSDISPLSFGLRVTASAKKSAACAVNPCRRFRTAIFVGPMGLWGSCFKMAEYTASALAQSSRKRKESPYTTAARMWAGLRRSTSNASRSALAKEFSLR